MSNDHGQTDLGNRSGDFAGVRGGAHHHPGLNWIAPLNEVNEMLATAQEAVLIGRADQYRLGDMLIPHVLTRLLHLSKVRCAGLFSADLTPVGGHATRNYGECLLEMHGSRMNLIHFGGETLSLDLVDGYRNGADELEAERFESLSLISARPELLRYARRRSGQISDFAYVLEPEGEFLGSGLSFHAVGLSDPAKLDDEARTRLMRSLRRADFLGVRDEAGADFLEAEGLHVERMPCALSVLPQVCARQLREVRDHAALEAIRHRFPNGWITVETSGVRWSDFERLASALREVSDREGLGLVFFEANRPAAAQSKLRHWVEAFPEWQAAEFPSSNLWEIASLLLHSRLYCGSCLSSRIVCMSGGVARINVPTGSPEVLSYCELWEHDSVPIEFSDGESWSDALDECLRTDLADLQRHSAWLHDRYRESFDRFCRATGIGARLVPAERQPQDSTVPMGFHPLAAERAAMAKSAPRNSRRPNFLKRLRA